MTSFLTRSPLRLATLPKSKMYTIHEIVVMCRNQDFLHVPAAPFIAVASLLVASLITPLLFLPDQIVRNVLSMSRSMPLRSSDIPSVNDGQHNGPWSPNVLKLPSYPCPDWYLVTARSCTCFRGSFLIMVTEVKRFQATETVDVLEGLIGIPLWMKGVWDFQWEKNVQAVFFFKWCDLKNKQIDICSWFIKLPLGLFGLSGGVAECHWNAIGCGMMLRVWLWKDVCEHAEATRMCFVGISYHTRWFYKRFVIERSSFRTVSPSMWWEGQGRLHSGQTLNYSTLHMSMETAI